MGNRFYLATHMITKRFRKRHYLMLSICPRAQASYALVGNFNVDFIVKIGLNIFIGRNKSRPPMKHGASKMCRITNHAHTSEWLKVTWINFIYKYFHNSSH